MTDTTTYAPQQGSPAGEPPAHHTQQRSGWPVNPAYQGTPVEPPVPPDDRPGTQAAAPRRAWRRLSVTALVAALVIGGGVAGGVAGARLDHDSPDPLGPGGTGPAIVAGSGLAGVVAAVSPSIVTIKVATAQGTAEGSGIVLTADGQIVTNNHVVEGAAGAGAVTVALPDGRSATATVAATDPAADIAVLRARGLSGLTPASLGDSSALRVGDQVLAFGSPLGLAGTVTSGIVSALDRSLSSSGESLSGLVQTDAAINPGNSGGALVDTAGRVVGLNVAIATTGQDSGNIGVGFAIPVNSVRQIVNKIAGQ